TETVIYGNNSIFPALAPFATGRANADRPGFLESDKAFFAAMALAFALIALGLTVIRNGPFGRRLAAMKDSPDACVTLGMDLTVTKLQVFTLASAIAGFGGGLLAMWNSTNVGLQQYALLEGGALGGLPLLLVAVIGGITSVFGAAFGAILFVGMPLVGTWADERGKLIGVSIGWVRQFMNVLPGLAGIGLAQSPDGAARQIADGASDVAEAIARLRAGGADGAATGSSATHREPEQMLAAGRLTDDDVAHLDHVLGLSWGREHPVGSGGAS
ncbi:MAG TPA: hypothetical protein VK507_14420, partial [Iamia sp.]|nr:hypothetical protein [Iamia sp.]